MAQALTSDGGEIFEIVRHAGDSKRVRLRASNGQFLQATTKDSVTADSGGDGSWGSDGDDPLTKDVTTNEPETGAEPGFDVGANEETEEIMGRKG